MLFFEFILLLLDFFQMFFKFLFFLLDGFQFWIFVIIYFLLKGLDFEADLFPPLLHHVFSHLPQTPSEPIYPSVLQENEQFLDSLFADFDHPVGRQPFISPSFVLE